MVTGHFRIIKACESDHWTLATGHFEMVVTLFEDVFHSEAPLNMFSHKKIYFGVNAESVTKITEKLLNRFFLSCQVSSTHKNLVCNRRFLFLNETFLCDWKMSTLLEKNWCIDFVDPPFTCQFFFSKLVFYLNPP